MKGNVKKNTCPRPEVSVILGIQPSHAHGNACGSLVSSLRNTARANLFYSVSLPAWLTISVSHLRRPWFYLRLGSLWLFPVIRGGVQLGQILSPPKESQGLPGVLILTLDPSARRRRFRSAPVHRCGWKSIPLAYLVAAFNFRASNPFPLFHMAKVTAAILRARVSRAISSLIPLSFSCA